MCFARGPAAARGWTNSVRSGGSRGLFIGTKILRTLDNDLSLFCTVRENYTADRVGDFPGGRDARRVLRESCLISRSSSLTKRTRDACVRVGTEFSNDTEWSINIDIIIIIIIPQIVEFSRIIILCTTYIIIMINLLTLQSIYYFIITSFFFLNFLQL